MISDLPTEYKRGFTKFLNCKIDLSKRVFIPRIETEFWVKQTLKELKNAENTSRQIKVLDMFAGSGCIGIAILKNTKNSRVDFVDINKKATSQIKINLKLNKVSPKRYRVFQSDLFKKIKASHQCLGGGYDFIFANPPYVAKERLREVQPSVLKYEPKKAILAGKKGLFFIQKFLKEAKKFLKEPSFAKASDGKGGVIYLEIDPHQKEDIRNILEKGGYKEFKFFKDQFKKYRWVKMTKS